MKTQKSSILLTHAQTPVWWNTHGTKMYISDIEQGKVVLKSSAAQVTIVRASLLIPYPGWLVLFEINCYEPTEEGFKGRILFEDRNLRSAFCLSSEFGPDGEQMIERYGGTCAAQGQWIRWEEFLNIPGPGTGNDDDPNVSIYVNSDIRRAVHGLLLQKYR